MANLSPFGPQLQYEDSAGEPAVGYRIFFYVNNSVGTKQDTYTTAAGTVVNTNPIVLNALGQPANGIFFPAGQAYTIQYAPPGSDDPPNSPIWTRNDVYGVNDATAAQDQWVASSIVPTYVSATSFTLPGDQTFTFQAGRRVKTTNSGGTVYSTITSSAYAALTTVTVLNDSGTLDSGLSAVSYGLLSNTNPSIPNFVAKRSDIPTTLRNGYLTATTAASAVTYAIKTLAGNDPSPGDPVYVDFRSATVGSGTPSDIAITSAMSFVVSSGSTQGTRNGIPFRIWGAIFNDGGTLRLGTINCVTSSAGAGTGSDVSAIYPLSAWGIASSTAEGGAGAADSAQVFYTGTAVSSKAFVVVGYATWESGLATAGTWSSDPTRVQPYGPGVPLPGQIVQEQGNNTGASASGTTTMPLDDTIPQNTEGDQYLSQAITPSSAANVVDTDVQAFGVLNDSGNVLVYALFEDSTANALVAGSQFGSTATNSPQLISLKHRQLAATTSATTKKFRAGRGGGAGTAAINGSAAGGRLLGGVYNSFMRCREIMG